MKLRISSLFSLWLSLTLVLTLQSRDLTTIQKPTLKEPAYRNKPEYALLVLGAKCEKQLWMVHDGDVLYFDRTGSGDLTVPEARVSMDAKASAPSEFDYVFDIGKLPGMPGEPVNVQLVTRRLSSLPELNSSMKQAVSRDANAVTYALHLQSKHPTWKGLGVEGRLMYAAGYIDHRGALLFGKTAAEAPVIHIGGPLQILPYGDQPRIAAGSSREITLAVGTPGVGAGSTAFIGYEKTISPGALPSLEVKYSNGELQKQELKERCCGVNLYGKLLVPENAPAGKAEVTISLNGWAEGNVACSKLSLEILEKRIKAIPQSVSLRPKLKYTHQDRSGGLYQLQFSPDGTKLFASSYPGGTLQWWDAATGQQIHHLDTGSGLRASPLMAQLSPDWKTVWVGEQQKGKYEMVEKDGKPYIKWTFNGRLRSWDTATGKALEPIEAVDGRSFGTTRLSRDGRYLAVVEDVSATMPREMGRKSEVSVYDLKTRQKLAIPPKYSYFSDFTSDSQHLLLQEMEPDNPRESFGWHLIALPEGNIIRTMKKNSEFQGDVHHMFADGKRTLNYLAKVLDNSHSKFNYDLQLFDMDEKKRLASISLGNQDARKHYQLSTDEKWLITYTMPSFRKPPEKPTVLEIHSASDLKPHQEIMLPVTGTTGMMHFHPTQPLMVITSQQFPKEAYLSRDFVFNEDEHEQARLLWIDLMHGKVLRMDILPPSFPKNMLFTKDGRQLLIGGQGSILLYDVPPELVK